MNGPALNLRTVPLLLAPMLALACTACNQGADPMGTASEAASIETMDADASEPAREPVKSIIRPDVDHSTPQAPVINPEALTLAFPDARISDDARAALDTLLASPANQTGGPITIRGHSDSSGSDTDNLAASRRRAEAVRDYLVSKGAEKDRITVIAMGESSPIAPNRKPDGTDDPQAREKNRRVDIRIDLPSAALEEPADKTGREGAAKEE